MKACPTAELDRRPFPDAAPGRGAQQPNAPLGQPEDSAKAFEIRLNPKEITVKKGEVKIDDANVVKTDIPASNGVIHVIDAVILPK